MSTIDEIKDRLDIVEVIGESVQLRKAGRNYTGFCPFHQNTRTPAFTVFPDTQSFYCFGCQASGTVFDFVMRRQGLDFREALEQLAARAGIELKERSSAEQQQDQQRTRLLEISATAAKYFNYVLLSLQRGQPARDYLEQRAINHQTVEAFQLGYSLDDWGHLLTYLTDKKGFAPEEVEAAGLAIHREQGGYHDRFRGRLIFPIRNVRGEVVGFGGRALGDAHPKYLNTPQTLLFDKSQVLYGLDLAREGIRNADATVIVEGYVDVLTAHQHGFRNVVAPLGTSLTAGHVALLKRLSRNVYLALDADAAGQRATLRGLNALQNVADDDATHQVVTAQGLVRWESDITLRIINMPPGQDPDEVIKADPERWRTLIAEAVPVVDFYIDAYTADLDLQQAQDQRTALDRLLPLLAQLDSTQQRVYIARLEQVIGIRAELILDLLRGNDGRRTAKAGKDSRRASDRNQRSHPGQPVATDSPAAQRAARRVPTLTREDHLLSLILRYPSAHVVVEELLTQSLVAFPQVRELLGDTIERLLERTENRLIWQALKAHSAEHPAQNLHEVHGDFLLEKVDEAVLPEELREHAARLVAIALPQPQEYRYRQEAERSVWHLRVEQVRRWQRRLSQQANDQEDPEECMRLLGLISELQRYQGTINTPRRSSTFPDLRDTTER